MTRTILTQQQVQVLRRAYFRNCQPSQSEKFQLVEETGLNYRIVTVWFQNRLCKDMKREAERIPNKPINSRQLQILKSHFNKLNGRRHLPWTEYMQLAAETGLTSSHVQYWFENRLPEDKKTEKTSETISP